jgi:phage-related holin
MREYIVKALIVIISLIAPIHSMLIACGVLIVADLITGIMAARKRGEKINSAGLRTTVSKMLIFQIAIISGYVLEVYMLENLLPVSKIVAGVIGMVEFTSILENASVIAGKDILKLVLDKLGSKNAGK